MKKIKFGVDKINVYGPKLDGSYRITLDTGEYEREKVGELVKLNQPNNFIVTIEQNG